MKILYSSWSGPKIAQKSSLKMAELSNFFSQKHGFETIFVGDKKSIEAHKEIPFNKIMEFDDRINQVPKCMWSAGKLIALSMMSDPVIHVDADLFFITPPIKEKLGQEIICFHSESYETLHWFQYYNIYKKENIYPLKTEGIIPISYNSALIGGQNIDLIKKHIDELIDFVIENKVKIEKIFEKNTKKIENREGVHDAFAAVLLEQIWLYQTYRNEKKEICCYLDDVKNLEDIDKESEIKGIKHFWGKKNSKYVENTINELYEFYIKK
jgi:hypothetical protein